MRDDASISNDVREQFAADGQAGPLEITVDTKAGVVHLAGSVPNESDRNLVEQIARDTVGVREVDNDVMFGTSPARRNP
jgi:osmotically-inducible protein OsmY